MFSSLSSPLKRSGDEDSGLCSPAAKKRLSDITQMLQKINSSVTTYLEPAVRCIDLQEGSAAKKFMTSHKKEILGYVEEIERALGTVISSANQTVRARDAQIAHLKEEVKQLRENHDKEMAEQLKQQRENHEEEMEEQLKQQRDDHEKEMANREKARCEKCRNKEDVMVNSLIEGVTFDDAMNNLDEADELENIQKDMATEVEKTLEEK